MFITNKIESLSIFSKFQFSCSNNIRCFKQKERGEVKEDYIDYPWANGSKCGKGRWCQQGQCVDKTDIPKFDRTDDNNFDLVITNGGWSQWKK